MELYINKLDNQIMTKTKIMEGMSKESRKNKLEIHAAWDAKSHAC